METVACPHCTGEILDEPALAGQKVECPHCGKIVKMLDAPAAPPKDPRPAAAAKPVSTKPSSIKPAAKPAAPRPAAPRGSQGAPPSATPAAPMALPVYDATPPTAAPPPASISAGVPAIAIDPSPSSSPRTVPRRPADNNPWLWPAILGGGAAVVAILLGVLASRGTPVDPNSPGGQLMKINEMMARGDWNAAFDRLSRQTIQNFEKVAASQYSGEGTPTAAELRSEVRSRFAQVMQAASASQGGRFSRDMIIVSENRRGNRAAVTIRAPGGGAQITIQMVFEDGIWKMDLPM